LGTKWLPSDPKAVAKVLREKSVKYRAVEKKPPPSFKDAWDSLNYLLRHERNTLQSPEKALETLTAVMRTKYVDEMEFDAALFASLRDCLAAFELPQPDGDIILLKLGDTQEYAVGIARQKSPATNLVQDELIEDDTTDDSLYTGTGMDVKSIEPDHLVGLFHNDLENTWSLTDCFSVVKLKTSDSTCKSFEKSGKVKEDPELWNRHAAIGQVVLCNLEFVLRSQAKRGVLKDHLPLAVIAGKKKQIRALLKQDTQAKVVATKVPRRKLLNKILKNVFDAKKQALIGKTTKQALQWVSGAMQVPQACGDSFYYSVHDSGRFSDSGENGSIEQAVALYIDTIRFGLEAAIKVQEKLALGETPLAVPSSGQTLMIGNVTLNQLQFCASPIPGAVTSHDPTIAKSWTVSQGDLFRGRLNVGEVVQSYDATFFRRGSKQQTKPSNVLVKVSSTTVHDLFTDLSNPYNALRLINAVGGALLVEEIGSVLHAIVPDVPALVTIMDDLTMDGYNVLKPVKHRERGNLRVLWAGFQDLAERVLLPMAKLDIIHTDIRPGSDKTSNILCKFETDEGGLSKATLKLIDYESLVLYRGWDPHYLDGRYMQKDQGWDATTYLWWQCMAVAYTWKESINADSLRTDKVLADMKHALLVGTEGPAWLHKYCDQARGKTNAETLKATLVELADEFSEGQHPVSRVPVLSAGPVVLELNGTSYNTVTWEITKKRQGYVCNSGNFIAYKNEVKLA
jgi:hypothetical protein